MTSPAYGWSTSRAPHDSCPGVTRLMIIGRLTPPAPSSNITNPESMPKSMFPTLSRDPVLASPKAWDPCRIMGAMWMRQPRCLGIGMFDRRAAASSISSPIPISTLACQNELDASDRRCLYTRNTRYSEGNSLRLDFSALTTPPAAVTSGNRLDLYGCSASCTLERIHQHLPINSQGKWYNRKVSGIFARVNGRPSNCLYPVLPLHTDLQRPNLRYHDVDT
ncbi:hypothetical protein BJ912DRAFT_181367 [Pholiota molesta]|nr:hypothetical protein BJ912DRAFT_181367 [Pholiota molesta]